MHDVYIKYANIHTKRKYAKSYTSVTFCFFSTKETKQKINRKGVIKWV